MNQSQPGLFDASHQGRETVFFLTNRNNLVRTLASGILMPLAGFAVKYYDDLLRLAPGRLPFLAHGASANVTAMVAPEPTAFPVMLEFARTSLADAAFPALMDDGNRDMAGWAHPRAALWAPSGTLAISGALVAIHFRTGREQEEFEAREYSDARLKIDLHRVSPDLFQVDGPSAETVTTWLTSLDPAESPSVDQVRAEDRRSGALLLGTLTAISDDAELRGWGQLLSGKAPGRQAGRTASRIARALDGSAKPRDAEEIALQVCLEVLGESDRFESWRPVDLLGQIRDLLESQLKAKSGQMISALDRAGAILRSEEEFEGLRPAGSQTMKALLITLLRPEPQRLIGWDPGGEGSTQEVMNLAAVMVGMLTGRSLTPSEMRPIALDDWIAQLESERLSSSGDRVAPAYKPRRLGVHDAGGSLQLKHGDAVLTERPIAKPAPTGTPVDVAFADDRALAQRAAAMAVKKGWHDCIQSTVRAPASAFLTELPGRAGEAATIRFPGIGSVQYEIVPEAFLRRLNDGELSQEEVSQLMDGDARPHTTEAPGAS